MSEGNDANKASGKDEATNSLRTTNLTEKSET